MDCPGTPNCNGRGSCEDVAGVPTCICDEGWTGDDCSEGMKRSQFTYSQLHLVLICLQLYVLEHLNAVEMAIAQLNMTLQNAIVM